MKNLTLKLIILLCSVFFLACKKNNTNGGSSTTATVTFTNPQASGPNYRLMLSTTSDTVFPYPNAVLDITLPGGTSVSRTDIPAGKRKLVLFKSFPGSCVAGTPIINNIICTTWVNKNVEFLANQTYTTIIQQ